MKQIVIFVKGGVVRSVAERETDGKKCIVVDYDNAAYDDDDYEMEMLGCDIDQFDKTAKYIY